jgi:hypothetical protein
MKRSDFKLIKIGDRLYYNNKSHVYNDNCGTVVLVNNYLNVMNDRTQYLIMLKWNVQIDGLQPFTEFNEDECCNLYWCT